MGVFSEWRGLLCTVAHEIVSLLDRTGEGKDAEHQTTSHE